MLITMVVSSGLRSYSTQHVVDSWHQVPEALLASQGFREFSRAAMPSAVEEPLRPGEVFLFTPMTGLKNAWVGQGGRNGEFFSVIAVRTVEHE
jgi:hypothetical protein